MDNYKFPSIKKTIDDFINDDDGNITRNQLVTIGAMILVMSIMSGIDAYAKHGSHRSHGSHGSHSSTSYIRDHSNHASHSDHGSHESHSSHTSHSNTASHSNSLYSAEGDVSYGPSVSSIPSVTSGSQSNSSFIVDEAVTRNMDSEALADAMFPKVPNVPDVPATIGAEAFQDPSVIAALAVDPNHTAVDDVVDIIKTTLKKN